MFPNPYCLSSRLHIKIISSPNLNVEVKMASRHAFYLLIKKQISPKSLGPIRHWRQKIAWKFLKRIYQTKNGIRNGFKSGIKWLKKSSQLEKYKNYITRLTIFFEWFLNKFGFRHIVIEIYIFFFCVKILPKRRKNNVK